MHMKREKILARHGVEISIEAVNDYKIDSLVRDCEADVICEFSRRQFSWIHRSNQQVTALDKGFKFHSEPGRTCLKRLQIFVKNVKRSLLSAFCCAVSELSDH